MMRPEWHPAWVHYPIALLTVWPALEALNLWRGRRAQRAGGPWDGATSLLLGLGAVGALGAVATGQMAVEARPSSATDPASHVVPAEWVPWMVLALLLLRFVPARGTKRRGRAVPAWPSRRRRWAAVVAGGLLAGWVAWTGYTGGRVAHALVFDAPAMVSGSGGSSPVAPPDAVAPGRAPR